MNVKNRITLTVGILVSMIVLLVALSIVNLQILTATEPDSPAAAPGLGRALFWVAAIGGGCIAIGLVMLFKLPSAISRPVREITHAIQEIANHNYSQRLNIQDGSEFTEVSKNFNRMAKRLEDYHASSISTLKAEKNYREVIINSISDPIIGLDKDMLIMFINDEALNVLNLKRTEVLNKPATELSMNNDLLRRLIRVILDGGEDKKETLKIYADDKESFFQAHYITTHRPGPDGVSQLEDGYVIILKNVTEFKELDSAKTTFISTISHELKTPISAILMSLQLLEDKRIGGLNVEQKGFSDSIKENSERLLSITGELLNMTQVESGKLQLKPKITKPIEIIEYAIKANRIQAEKFGIQIELDYPQEGKMPKLFVDSEKIAWVVSNLLSNAIRYSPENGRVVIGAHQCTDGYMELYVQDFGRGIDTRYHKSIFDHYFRVPGTKVQGSGLGLSISKDFVEAHSGVINVESEIGSGSKFIVRLKI